MDNNSLFTTRQLTEYRKWPDGRKGCLFYIPQLHKFDTEEIGGIYLVKSPFRKLDKIGEFNQLHKTEIEALNREDCIIANFGAFLYSVNFDWGFERNYDTVINYWQDYCEWTNQFRSPEEKGWEILFSESRFWLQRDKDFLASYVGFRLNSHKEFLFDRIVLDEVMKKMASTYDMMWNVSPYILIPNKLGTSYQVANNDLPDGKDVKSYIDQLEKHYPIQYYLYRNPQKIALTKNHEEFHFLWYDKKNDCLNPILEYSEEDGDIISGFPAMFTNFIASHWAYEQITNSNELDQRTKTFLDCFVLGENSINIDALEFSFFGMDCEEVYKNYIKILLESAEYAGRAKSHDPLDSEQRKQWRYYATVFDIEKSLYELGQNIYDYLSNEQAETLRTYTRDFFRYLLKMIEGSEFYEEELDAFKTLFEDASLLPQRLGTKPIRKLKSITELPEPKLKNNKRVDMEDVYNYIIERKKVDPDFEEMCNTLTLTNLCPYLSDLFGWDVSPNSLGTYLRRNKRVIKKYKK